MSSRPHYQHSELVTWFEEHEQCASIDHVKSDEVHQVFADEGERELRLWSSSRSGDVQWRRWLAGRRWCWWGSRNGNRSRTRGLIIWSWC